VLFAVVDPRPREDLAYTPLNCKTITAGSRPI
jgi:hypothetical protein